MVAQLNDCPDSKVFQNADLQQVIDLLKGRSFAPVQIVRENVAVFQIDADGAVSLSPDGALPASNYFVYPGMIVLWDSADPVPPNYAICDGTNGTPDLRDRFPVGAGGLYALGATGGAAAIDLADHTHTSAEHSHDIPDHAHTSAEHEHVHHHDMNHEHTYDHDHTLSNHKHEYNHEHTYNHDHGGVTNGPSPSLFEVRDDVETVVISDPDHIHTIDPTDSSDHTKGGSEDGGSNNFLGSRDGFTTSPVDGSGSYGHAQTSKDYSGPPGGTHLTERWILELLNGSDDTNTDAVGGLTTPDDTGEASLSAAATTPDDTGPAGAATLAIVPPYYACYFIKRLAA